MQNVNLYLPELRPKREWVTAWSVAIAAIGFCFVMLLASWQNQKELQLFEASVILLENQKVETSARLDKIKTKSPSGDLARLDQEIANLRNKINARLKVNNLIEGQSLGNDSGYSGRLFELAKASTSDMEIDRFRFSQGASFIEIRGYSRQPERIAELVKEIKESKSFDLASIAPLTVVKNKKTQSFYEFSYGFEPLTQFEELTFFTNTSPGRRR